MKHLLLTTIAAVVLVGCGESQQSTPAPEAKPVEPVVEVPAQQSAPLAEAKPVEPVAEAAKPEPPTAKAPVISIHEAAEEGNTEAVKKHLVAGADVNAKEEWGWTPLHFTTTKEIAELLIGNGADVNAKNDGGFTPLHYAASRRDKEIAELLIAKDADVNAKMEDGDTPLDWAIEINRTETADLLRKHGAKTGEELKGAGN